MSAETTRREARTRFMVLTAAGLGTFLFLLPVRSFAAVPEQAPLAPSDSMRAAAGVRVGA